MNVFVLLIIYYAGTWYLPINLRMPSYLWQLILEDLHKVYLKPRISFLFRIPLEIPSMSNWMCDKPSISKFWFEILSFSIEIQGFWLKYLGFSLEILGISKICDNRILLTVTDVFVHTLIYNCIWCRRNLIEFVFFH